MGQLRIVAGRWGRRRLAVPRGGSIRPTSERVREAWMSALEPRLRCATVLDLFAGSGALGLEALSRGAARVTFVEYDRRALDCLRANVATLGADEEATIVALDVFEFLRRIGDERFDIALADPPYGQGLAARLAARFTAAPFARVLCVEHRRDEVRDVTGAGTRQRRYGDTTVTCLQADDSDSEEDS